LAAIHDKAEKFREFIREHGLKSTRQRDEIANWFFQHKGHLSADQIYRDVKESDQAVVQYTLESDPDHPGEQALFRRAKPRIDDEPDRGGRKDLVADHVRALQIQYWDPKRKDWVREWTTRSMEHAKELPPRVRLELEVKLADGRAERFVTEARIEIRRPLGTR
jgi:general secretion pathway protein J